MRGLKDKVILITGANRGIGQALVEEALSRGATRVYAGTRGPLRHPDPRVMPVTVDVTSAAQIQAAVDRVESLDILINNAGLALYDDLSDRDRSRTAPSRQSIRHLRGDPGLPAVAYPFSRGHRQQRVGDGIGPRAGYGRVRDL